MDVNWWKMYSKSSCEYGVGNKLSKDTNIKRHPCLFTWEWVKQIPNWNYPNFQCIMIYGT